MERDEKIQDKNIEDLYRKVVITSKCKHNASARLKKHHLYSQWTLALISTVLIVSPLVEAAHENDGAYVYTEYFGAIQVGFAVLVLVASLLVGELGFCLRSDKFHRCGAELDKLSYRIKDEDNKSNFYDLYKRYNSILDKYENHKTIDHLLAKKALSRSRSNKEGMKNRRVLSTFEVSEMLKYWNLMFLEYLPYKIVPSLLIIMAIITYTAHFA